MLYSIGDINGATRICLTSAALAAVSGMAIIYMLYTFYAKANAIHSKVRTAICVFALGAITALMAIVAFLVRSPCRKPRGYYIGCGVNLYRDAGFVLSAMAIIISITMICFAMRTGWLILCYSIYCIDYFAQFSHQIPALFREIFLTGAITFGVYGTLLIIQSVALRFEFHSISKLISRITF